MELILQILLGLVAFVCISVGAKQMIKGTGAFLTERLPLSPELDNTFRFLNGMFIGFGVLMIWALVNLYRIHELIYYIGIVIVLAGFGRVFSKINVGSAGKYFDTIMVVEIILGLSIMLLQYMR